MEIQEQLKNLNNARIGSFGEFIFRKYAQENNLRIFRVHKGRTDYLLNGKKIDIKTKRNFKNSVTYLISSKIMNITYIFVVFENNNVAIYDDAIHLLWKCNYERVKGFFEEWKVNEKIDIPTAVWKEENDYANIKREITDFFMNKGLKPRIIYRTNQADWGDDAIANNLIPNAIKEDHVTVLISFNYEKKRDAIDYLIAFPDADSLNFQLLPDDRLHSKKRISFKNFPNKYRFANMEELFIKFPPFHSDAEPIEAIKQTKLQVDTVNIKTKEKKKDGSHKYKFMLKNYYSPVKKEHAGYFDTLKQAYHIYLRDKDKVSQCNIYERNAETQEFSEKLNIDDVEKRIKMQDTC